MTELLFLTPEGDISGDDEVIQAAEDELTIDGILAATERATFGSQLMVEYDESDVTRSPVATNGPSWSGGKVDDDKGDTGPGDEN